jgi:phage terminase small subunit
MCKLSINEERFVHEYVSCGIARVSYVRAYPGSSLESGEVCAHRLLGKVRIQKAIEEERERLRERTQITREQIAAEYSKLAFAQMTDFADWDGNGVTLKKSTDLSPEQAAAVVEVKQQTGKVECLSIKLHDKKGALDSLAKMLGYTVDKHEIKGEIEIKGIFDALIDLDKPEDGTETEQSETGS